MPRLRSHRLADLGAAFGRSATPLARIAPPTSRGACVCGGAALVGIGDLDRGVLERIATSPWSRVAERTGSLESLAGTGHDIYDLQEVRRPVAADKAEAIRRRRDRVHLPACRRVCAEFSAGGIAGRMYPGFEQRAEQVEMARAVLSAFETDTHLAIEAGPRGKSVAYLSRRRSSRRSTEWAWVWRPRPTRSWTSSSTTSCLG
jgi:ATP-dependent DNA helicase DinG